MAGVVQRWWRCIGKRGLGGWGLMERLCGGKLYATPWGMGAGMGKYSELP